MAEHLGLLGLSDRSIICGDSRTVSRVRPVRHNLSEKALSDLTGGQECFITRRCRIIRHRALHAPESRRRVLAGFRRPGRIKEERPGNSRT